MTDFTISIKRAEKRWATIMERIWRYWPPEIRVRGTPHQEGGYISTEGGQWEKGATIHIYADGVSWSNGPLLLDTLKADDNHHISSLVDQRFRQTPRDRWTPVFIRATDEKGREAIARGPDSAFYIG